MQRTDSRRDTGGEKSGELRPRANAQRTVTPHPVRADRATRHIELPGNRGRVFALGNQHESPCLKLRQPPCPQQVNATLAIVNPRNLARAKQGAASSHRKQQRARWNSDDKDHPPVEEKTAAHQEVPCITRDGTSRQAEHRRDRKRSKGVVDCKADARQSLAVGAPGHRTHGEARHDDAGPRRKLRQGNRSQDDAKRESRARRQSDAVDPLGRPARSQAKRTRHAADRHHGGNDGKPPTHPSQRRDGHQDNAGASRHRCGHAWAFDASRLRRRRGGDLTKGARSQLVQRPAAVGSNR